MEGNGHAVKCILICNTGYQQSEWINTVYYASNIKQDKPEVLYFKDLQLSSTS